MVRANEAEWEDCNWGSKNMLLVLQDINTKYIVFVVNSTSVTMVKPNKPSNSISLCINNREDPLCSQCSPGYSVVFGSNDCRQCSSWWLLILIAYALAGPLFIYMLYTLKLTLSTGKLNGIIFCVQNASNNYVIIYYISEGSVSHINCVWPVFLTHS